MIFCTSISKHLSFCNATWFNFKCITSYRMGIDFISSIDQMGLSDLPKQMSGKIKTRISECRALSTEQGYPMILNFEWILFFLNQMDSISKPAILNFAPFLTNNCTAKKMAHFLFYNWYVTSHEAHTKLKVNFVCSYSLKFRNLSTIDLFTSILENFV